MSDVRGGETILFVMLNPGYAGHYEAPLRILIGRGHKILLAYQSDRNKDGVEQAYGERLRRDHPDAVTLVRAPERESDRWADLAALLRQGQDYLRYFRPEFAGAYGLRARAGQATPWALRGLIRMVAALGPLAVRGAERALESADRLIPPSTAIATFVRDSGADVVLVTPLVDTMSTQVDFVRAAQRLGIPAGHCVASWDNLTNKGSMRVVPDRVFVWNEAQKREAVTLHRVPAAHVVVTGAQLFDRWFETTPGRTREEFCQRVGLPADRPFLLYLGSSSFIAPQEGAFVEKWVRAIRGAPDAAVATAGILIRPHPNNAAQFMAKDYTVFGHVVVWPPFDVDPLDPSYKRDYFESMFYCAAAVGVNTSAMIETAIVGRPVHTVLSPEFRHAQRGTLHFEHLTTVGGGLLHVAESLDDHVGMLADAAAGRAGGIDSRSAAFVAGFVRPLGLDRPAAPMLADGIETMGALRREAATEEPGWQKSARQVLSPVAALATVLRTAEAHPWWIWLLKPAVAMWVTALRLRAAIGRSDAWLATRERWRKTRWAVRHTFKDARGWLGNTPRRSRRAFDAARKRSGRVLQRSAHAMTTTRKQMRRSARTLPKQLRRGTRSAARALRLQLVRLLRRAPNDLA